MKQKLKRWEFICRLESQLEILHTVHIKMAVD